MASFYINLPQINTVTSGGGGGSVTQGTVPWIVAGQGTAGVSATGVVTIQGIASGTAVPVSGTFTPSGTQNVNLIQVGGSSIAIGQAAMAASLPVVIASNQSAVTVAQATAANLNATVTQGTSPWVENLSQVGGASISLGQAAAASSLPVVTQANSAPVTQNITAQDVGSTTTAMANGQNFITGSPTANSAASFAVASFESVEVQVTGTWTGTLSSEISMDGGTTWFVRGVKQAGVAYISSTFTNNFAGGLNITGMTNYRVRATAAWTGTATVKIIAGIAASSITVTNPLTLRDSTTQSIMSTVKAASTAAVATDTALVVGISPNSNTVTVSAGTSGGSTPFWTPSAASTNATSLKGSAGQVFAWAFSNTGAAPAFVKFYNKATAPTVGSDTPVAVIMVPANTTPSNGTGNNLALSAGIAFSTGIAFAVTGGIANSDTTAVALNQVGISIFYA